MSAFNTSKILVSSTTSIDICLFIPSLWKAPLIRDMADRYPKSERERWARQETTPLSISRGERRKKRDPLLSNFAFQVLLAFLGFYFLVYLLVSLYMVTGLSAIDQLKTPFIVSEQQFLQPHLSPRLPHLPIFPTIDDEESLIHQTLYEQKPTIAGIAAILYRFLNALHESNLRFGDLTSYNHNNERNFDNLQAAYYGLVRKHLSPLEAAYRGRPTFAIRNDDSIFVSIASFREHLLAETLMSLYGSAANPERLFVGVIVNNCFGIPGGGEASCHDTPQVIGKDKNGRDKLKAVDDLPDTNHIETFCSNPTFSKYCDSGQVRVLYVHEVDALGPAVARYYSSKLWGGETYYMQVDSHLHFATRWDELYIQDLKLAKSYPKAILSTYPPGFVNFRQEPPFTPGTRLCKCQLRQTEDWLPRLEMEGRSHEDDAYPTQMAFIGAGFFFTRAEFLVDVPFDPYLPWLFMGEEVALSIRAWTHGWNIYAPRKNLIGHQYRPIKMGVPHYWDTIQRFFHHSGVQARGTKFVHQRLKHMLGYPKFSSEDLQVSNMDESHNVLMEFEHYGLGTTRSRTEYLEFSEIDIDTRTCGPMKWCSEGTLE